MYIDEGNSQTRTYTVKLDKQAPTISNGSSGVTNITEKTSNAIPGSYFSITNPTTYSGAGITSCIDTSNGNKVVTNTNSLSVGTHNIKCIVTRENGLSANLTRTFTIKSAIKTPTEVMTNANAGTNGIIRTDNSGNKRYAGSNPNNYVCFGKTGTTCDAEHLYRIIGVFNGQMKIVKNAPYSTEKAWDTSWGTDWETASLKSELNSSSFFTNTDYIDAIHKGYVSYTKWNIGSPNAANKTYTLALFEDAESKKSITSYVGLISVTDYGYSSGNSECTRLSLLESSSLGFVCAQENWISLYAPWTLTVATHKSGSIWFVVRNSYIEYRESRSKNYPSTRPAMYLDSTVKIAGGTGTSSDPYILTK